MSDAATKFTEKGIKDKESKGDSAKKGKLICELKEFQLSLKRGNVVIWNAATLTA